MLEQSHKLRQASILTIFSLFRVLTSRCEQPIALFLASADELYGPITTLRRDNIRRNTAHTFGTFVTFESVESAESVKVLDTFSRQVPLTFDTFKKDKRDDNTSKRDKSS